MTETSSRCLSPVSRSSKQCASAKRWDPRAPHSIAVIKSTEEESKNRWLFLCRFCAFPLCFIMIQSIFKCEKNIQTRTRGSKQKRQSFSHGTRGCLARMDNFTLKLVRKQNKLWVDWITADTNHCKRLFIKVLVLSITWFYEISKNVWLWRIIAFCKIFAYVFFIIITFLTPSHPYVTIRNVSRNPILSNNVTLTQNYRSQILKIC